MFTQELNHDAEERSQESRTGVQRRAGYVGDRPLAEEQYNCEIICFTADLGQEEELDGLEEKALKSGASKLYIRDLREEFLTDFVYPTMKAGAIYEREYLLGTSFARPLIAKHLVDIAEIEGADAIAHGCTGKGNDQVRFEVTVMALNPKLKVIAPWREWDIRSREDALAYAEEFNIPVTSTLKSIYSRDRNLFHLSHEGGPLENPWLEPEEEMYKLSVSPENAPDEPQYVEIGFEQGVPVAVDGEKLSGGRPVHPPEQDRRGARHRADRSGRKPAGRHEESRRLRDARRHADPPGASSAGKHLP